MKIKFKIIQSSENSENRYMRYFMSTRISKFWNVALFHNILNIKDDVFVLNWDMNGANEFLIKKSEKFKNIGQ